MRFPKWRAVGLLLTILSGCSAMMQGQVEPGDYYLYGQQKITLKRLTDTTAAKVFESVDYQTKFPWLSNYFRVVGSSDLKDEPVLLKTASASVQMSLAAISSGVRSQEIHALPVYQLGSAKVVLQNELIVGFKEDQTDSTKAEHLLGNFSTDYERLPGFGLRYLVRVPNPDRTLAWEHVLAGNYTVAYAEPNFVVLEPTRPASPPSPSVNSQPPPAAGSNTALSGPPTYPSDSLFPAQWGLTKIGAPKAWMRSHGSISIKIAILDNGVDVGHPDLIGKIDRSYDVIFDSDVMDPPKEDAHGTEVAGVAAAVTNNGIGIAGVAPDVKLIPIRMMSSVDQQTESKSLVTVSNAFAKAVELDADVINCSWTDVQSKDVEAAIRAAATSKGRGGLGAVVVFAAGNDGGDVAFPALLSSSLPIIAVGASDERDIFKTKSTGNESWWGSNSGPELTVVAPGIRIATTAHRGSVPPGTDPYTVVFNGTSSAAPFVSGLAALILSMEPKLTASQVRDRIKNTADPVVKMPDPAGTMIGRIDACRAVGRTDCGQ